MAGALERSRENQYHLYNVDGLGDDITLVAKVRACMRSACRPPSRMGPACEARMKEMVWGLLTKEAGLRGCARLLAPAAAGRYE